MSSVPASELQRAFQTGQTEAKRLFEAAKVARALTIGLAGYVGVLIDVLLHRHMGERAVRLSRIAPVGVAVFFVGVWMGEPGLPALIGLVAALVYLVSAILRRREVKRRRRNNNEPRIHSRSCGEPLRLWGPLISWLGPRRTVRIAEPALVFIGGFVIAKWHVPLANLLLLVMAAQILRHYLEANASRDRVLDAIDSQIEAEQVAEATAPSPTTRQFPQFVVSS